MSVLRTAIAVCAMLACAPDFAISAQAAPNASDEITRCAKQGDYVDSKIAECTAAVTERRDKVLNDVYKRLLARLEPAAKEALQKAERAWITFRDAQCMFAYEVESPGTLAKVLYAGCMLEMTDERIRYLSDQLKALP